MKRFFRMLLFASFTFLISLPAESLAQVGNTGTSALSQLPDPVRPPMPDTLFLRFTQPGRDSFATGAPRIKLAGSTRPEARVSVNGIETKVYSSGAFVALVPLTVGPNFVRVVTTGSAGDSVVREFKVSRNPPPAPLPHDTLTIDESSVEPSQTMWLGSGDILNVRFKGSPGWEACFDIPDVESGIPMRELPTNEANGMPGIYVGQYRVQSTDHADTVQLIFRLRKSFWSREKVLSRARITIMPDQFPIVAEIGGKRPYMNAGLGSDRLGGAKLGFIQPGTQFVVTGRIGEYYRAQLSEDMLAWIPADSVRFLPNDAPLPRSLAGSISATGNDVQDVVTLSLSKRLPFTSEHYVSPNVIAVDIYGATSNTNWITHHLSAKGIASVRWMQVSANRYRLLITLKHASHWGYDVDYVGTSLRVRVKRPPVLASQDSVLKGMTIVLDAGHGGDAAGAVGATGAQEMNANMSIVRHLERMLLERGAKPVLTRTEAEGPSMGDRIETILGANATLLVSVHCNAGGDNSDPLGARGTSTYYRHAGFKPLADTIYSRLLELGLKEFGVVGSFNFSLNAPTQLPNVLVETAFFSHPEDEILLLDDGFRRSVAERVVAGVEAFLRTAP